ncbi:alpha/beta hydrolase [Pseudopelagicola sp. nBUS_19]|uniref:alpha/beta hydrolase n=1 Tax=Pseudopelagicola sp. nBUS_19 TaxID=3395316 RepID=UPI003EB7D391
MPNFKFSLFKAVCVLSIGVFSTAQAQNSPALDSLAFEVSLESTSDIGERVILVQNAIQTIEASATPDLRMYFDLNDLLLGLYLEQDQIAQAAELAAGIANFLLSNPESFNRDPVPYYKQSGELFAQSENIRQAIRAFENEANFRLEAGQTGAPLARVYEDLERLAEQRGDSAGVEKNAALRKSAIDPPESEVRATRDSGESGFSEVEVFYATDRARSGSSEPNEFYGHGRGDLEYGTVTVSIPSTHAPGAIEQPSIWRLEFGPKPTKHVMLREIDPMEVGPYFEKMQGQVAKSDRKEAFVFVHGFNSRFDAAARRAAQLAYDMNYSGVPILYSWPSAGKTFSYVADTAVVRLSGRRLFRFLEELNEKSGADTIHLVAHSMGNRALTDALELLALSSNAADQPEPMFGQVFFAAPDVDADLFREMVGTIRPLAERLTLYASENDWALAASRKLHGSAPRAGQAGEGILVENEFDTVDMTNLGEDMLAHTYFANDSSALSDIVSLLWQNSDPENRCGLEGNGTESTTVWKYQKGVCLDSKLVALMSHLWNLEALTSDDIRPVVQKYVDNPEEAKQLEKSLLALVTK